MGGYPVRFVDTAGIRRSINVAEKIGIEKALSTSKDADINVVFINNKNDIDDFKDIKSPIFVRSKQDINGGSFDSNLFYNISSKDNFGIGNFLNKIKGLLDEKIPLENISISRERHARCLSDTALHLKESLKEKNIDIFAEDIRLSVKNLSSLFGNVDIENILDIIFSDFCIGK